MLFISNIIFYFNEFYLFFTFMSLFFYYNFLHNKNYFKLNFTSTTLNSLTFFYFLLLSLFFILLDNYLNFFVLNNFFYFYMYNTNIFILFLKYILILLFCIYFFYLIIDQLTYSIQFNEYCFIFFLYILFSFLFLSVLDLLTFFLLLEFQSICFYSLIAIERNSVYSIESSLRYWILNALTSLFLLFSVVNFYVEFGVLDFYTLGNCFFMTFIDFDLHLFYYNNIFLSMLLFFISFFFKIGAFPFHVWSIDVYEFISSKITLFFLIFPKFLLFLVFLKLFYTSFDNFLNFFSKLTTFSFLFSIIFSVCFSIYQDKIKKIFILNSVFSTGFQLLFISLSLLESIQGFFLYILFYFITLFSFFFFKVATFEFNSIQITFNFNILNKLYYSNYFFSIIIIILTFSSLGIPPFANFFCKIFIFYSCILTKDYTDFLFLLLFSMISAFYHLRFLKSLFFDLCLGKIFFLSYLPWFLSYLLSFLNFILCFLFIDILPLFFFTNILIFYFLC